MQYIHYKKPVGLVLQSYTETLHTFGLRPLLRWPLDVREWMYASTRRVGTKKPKWSLLLK